MFKKRFPMFLCLVVMLLTVFCFSGTPSEASVVDAAKNKAAQNLKDYDMSIIIKYMRDNGYIVTNADSATKLGYLAGEQFKNNAWNDITVEDTGLPTEFVKSFNQGFNDAYNATTATTTTTSQKQTYVGNKNTKKFHYSYCSSVSDMKESNKVFNNSRFYFTNRDYEPCKICKP